MTRSDSRAGRIRLTTALRGVPAAIVLLTRIPIPRYRSRREDWRWAPAFFPLVGMMIGVLLALLWPLVALLGPFVAAVLVVTIGVLVSGALHEDGLADSADALGGAGSRERVFEILKDSRIGTYGALALIGSVVLRVSLLAALGEGTPGALVLSHATARTAPVWLMALLPYVTPAEHARSAFVASAGMRQAAIATGILLLIVAATSTRGTIGPAAAFAAVLGVAIVTAVCGRVFLSRAGGITGDFLGMNEQLGECAVLLVLAVSRLS